MRKYRLVAKKGEGTFSEVLKAQNVKDGRYHAIKCMKNRFDSIDQVTELYYCGTNLIFAIHSV
jgi:renal tumor antigen